MLAIVSLIIVLGTYGYGQSILDPILRLPESQLLSIEIKTSAADSLSRIKYALAKKYLKKDIQNALRLFDQALEYSEKTNDQAFSIQIKKSKALAYINLQEMENAIELLDEAAKYYKKTNEKAKYGSCLGFYAYLYTEINDYSKALVYSFEALEIFNELDDKPEIGNANNRIGILYSKMGELEKALVYYEKNIASSKMDGKRGIYRASVNNAGGIYLQLGNLQKAEAYLTEAFELRKRENSPKTLAYAFENLADLEIIKEDTTKAINYLDSAYLYFQKVDYRNGAAAVLTKKTLMLREMDDYEKYKSAVIETHEKLQEWNINNNEEVILSAYADILFEEGKTKEAYTNLQKSIQLFKEKNSDNTFAEIEKLELQLRKEKEESRIQELSKELEVKNIQRKFLYLTLGLGAALIMLLLYTNRDRRKKNKVISKSLEEREVLIKEIHHRVKNNLQIVSSLLSLQSRNIKDIGTKEAILDSRDRVKSMALIHQKLYQEDNLKGVDMESYLGNLVSSLSYSHNLNEKEVQVDFEVDPLILDIDSTIPIGLITNELITNALKYAFVVGKQGKIKVSLKEVDKELILKVMDNGSSMKHKADLKEGFGFQLIRSLGRKLEATPEIIIDDGLTIKLTINNYKKVIA